MMRVRMRLEWAEEERGGRKGQLGRGDEDGRNGRGRTERIPLSTHTRD